MWSLAAVSAGLWMLVAAGLVHAQTRILNAGARSLRDSVARRRGTVSEDSALLDRLEGISEDLAIVRARAGAEPTQDEVRADLVQLAHSLRREMRLLQHSVPVPPEPAAPAPASAERTAADRHRRRLRRPSTAPNGHRKFSAGASISPRRPSVARRFAAAGHPALPWSPLNRAEDSSQPALTG